MGKQNWRPANLLYPVPAVLVTVSDGERDNVLTVAWAGTVCSDPVMVSISVRKSRYSYDLLKKSREFVVNLTTAGMAKAVDYCGVRSGKTEDKFKTAGLTRVPSLKVGAPSIAECPVNLECRVTQILELGSHDMFLAEVVSAAVDERYLSPKGRLQLDKADLLAYSHGEYFGLGRKLGTFGYSVRKHKPEKKALEGAQEKLKEVSEKKQKNRKNTRKDKKSHV